MHTALLAQDMFGPKSHIQSLAGMVKLHYLSHATGMWSNWGILFHASRENMLIIIFSGGTQSYSVRTELLLSSTISNSDKEQFEPRVNQEWGLTSTNSERMSVSECLNSLK